MSLNKKESGYSAWNGTYEMSSLDKFAQAERRLATKKQALEDIQNEYELIIRQTFTIYKSEVQYWQLSTKSFIDKSITWLNMLKKNEDKYGNKLDKRKKYEERDAFEYYTSYIKDLLGINIMENISFCEYNFGEAEYIYFDYLGKRWLLEIPFVNEVKIRSFQDYGNSVFMLKLKYVDNHWCELVGSTFEEDELKDIMTKGIEKYCEVSNEQM